MSHRYPVLLWQDQEGFTTAALVDPQAEFGSPVPIVAYAESEKTALTQVKDALKWHYEEEPWRDDPGLIEARLVTIKVTLRPEYRLRGKVFPCSQPVTLRVEVVDCSLEGGVSCAVLPRFGLAFFYTQGELADLAKHYVQEALSGLTPHQLARYISVREARLESISVQPPREERSQRGLDLPTLESVAEPMNSKALRAGFYRPYGREVELDELVRRLAAPGGSVLLVGEQGCGKTSLILDAVRKREMSAERDKATDPRRFWMTRGARLIAGMRYLGEWEERLEEVLDELSQVEGMLCVEGLQELIQSGGQSPENGVAAFLMPYLERGELRVVAEATPTELETCRRLLPGFVDMFSVLTLSELRGDRAVEVLSKVKDLLNSRHRLEVDSAVATECHRLHQRFLPYCAFPGRCVRFLGQSYERAARTKSVLDRKALVEHFSRETGLPARFLQDEVALPASEITDFFEQRVVGQPQACQVVTQLVSRFKAGLNDPEKPLGVLFFCGPTGVGKTEMAKAIAEMFFGAAQDADRRFLRLDMSEYGGFGGASRLLGTDERPGDLIRKVREQPFSVILLDEFEKAHPDVFDLLMGVFDEGRLTDRWGRLTNFRSSVIVMTSNLGASSLAPLGFKNERPTNYLSEVMSYFRPEFFNRIDEVVSFAPLGPETIRQIAEMELHALARREGVELRGLKLRWSEPVVELLCQRGYDVRYGARPLKRMVEELVMTPLARLLVENPSLRDCHIELERDGDHLRVG